VGRPREHLGQALTNSLLAGWLLIAFQLMRSGMASGKLIGASS
jgi:hypothetical protein